MFGDVEAAIVAILKASAGVTAYNPVTVATDLIGYTKPARWVRVARTGGVPTLWMRLDNPLVTIAAIAEDKGAAVDLAAAARSAVFAARGLYSGNGLALYDVGDEAGLTWDPDDADPSIPRYTFTLSLVTRPA